MFKEYSDFINFLYDKKIEAMPRLSVLRSIFLEFGNMTINDYYFWIKAYEDGYMKN